MNKKCRHERSGVAGERRRPDPAGIVWVCPPAVGVGVGGWGYWESVLLDVGRTDLQRVLLTPILWAVNRRALWESVICTPLTPPPPNPDPDPEAHRVIGLSLDVRLPPRPPPDQQTAVYNGPSSWAFLPPPQ